MAYIKRLFNSSIEKSKKSREMQERLLILIDTITRTIYTNVSRGLFETHKIIYSFLIIISINRNNKRIKDTHWNILLRGAGTLSVEQQRAKPKNPEPKLISLIGWDLLYYLQVSEPEVYGGLADSVIQDWKHWS